MFRKQLIDVLLNNPMTLYDISKRLEIDKKSIEDDLKHLIKSLKKTEHKIVVHPAVCHKCSFAFSAEHLHKIVARGLSRLRDSGSALLYN